MAVLNGLELSLLLPAQPTTVDAHARSGLISGWIDETYLHPAPLPDQTYCTKITKMVLKVAMPILSALGCGFFIPVNMQAAKGNVALGVVLNLANGSSVCALDIWSSYGVIDEYLGNKSETEELLRRSGLSKRAKTITAVAAMGIGLISQAAVAYVGYTANGEKWLPAVVLFAADSPFPIYSCVCSLRDLIVAKQSDAEKAIAPYQAQAINVLQANHQRFLTLSPADKSAFLADCRSQIDGTSAREALLTKLYAFHEKQPTLNKCHSLTERLVFGLGLGFAFTQQALVARIGYLAGEHFSDGNEYAGFATGALVGMANIYLSGLSASTTSRDLYRTARDLFNGSHVRSLAAQLRPKLASTLKITGLALSAMSWGASVGMVEEAFDPGAFEEFMKITVSASWALITLKAFNDLSDVLIDVILSRTADTEEMQLFALETFWRKQIEILSIATPSDFAEHIFDLPDAVLNRITDDPSTLVALAKDCLNLRSDLEGSSISPIAVPKIDSD